MVERSISRRRYVLGTVGGVVATAGCLSDLGSDGESAADETDESTKEVTETTETDDAAEGSTTGESGDADSATVTARLVDSGGSSVTTGELIALGDPEGLVAVAPDDDGRVSMELTADSEYTFQYTQGADSYPDDDRPDLFTVGRRTLDGDTDLGQVQLPRAYDVAVRVETAGGEDVTDDATVFVRHTSDGVTSGFELLNNPIELAGDVTVEAEYDGSEASTEVSVTDARTVSLTVGSEETGDGDLATVSGSLVDPSGAPVTNGEVIALGDPEGLVAAAPNDDGRFSMELTDGNTYSFQYTQGADAYPDDGLPDLYTIAERTVDGDIGLAEQRLPEAYDVGIRVETADGEDVTDEAAVSVSHTNFGTTTGFELTTNPIELVGDVTVEAEYDGATASTEASIDESQPVVVTVGGYDGDEETATVTGRLVDASGGAVTNGQMISLGEPEGLRAVAPDDDGGITLELTAGNTYDFQYTQGTDGYPDDDLPDLFTVDRRMLEPDTDLGEIQLPRAYDLEIRVETAGGEDVTEEASVSVNHTNDGVTTGFELLNNPIELVGDVTVEAEYDGATGRTEVSVTGDRSVVVSLG